MAPKRHAEVVDLTADDAPDGSSYRAPKQSRTLYNGAQRATNSSSQENMTPGDMWDYDDEFEEHDASQEAPDATQGYSQEHYNYLLYGALDDKIVGVRYYNGYATEGETVVLRREPHNQYDANAIRVNNVQEEQIGHIPRGLAAKLAKYMDDRSLLIEAQITGHKGYYECPIELLLYGTDDPIQRQELMARMKKDRLPVGRASERQRREAAEKKEQERRAKEAAKQMKKKGVKGAVAAAAAAAAAQRIEGPEISMAEFAAGLSQGVPSLTGPSLEDIITGSERFNPRNIEEFVEEFGVKEEDLAAMPQAPQPNALVTELHPFQLQGLQWMLDKESPKLPTKEGKSVVQLWRPHTSVPNVYTNVATSFSVKNPPLASGGILADDMGLGKTIQTISLIVADRELGRGAKDATGATLILAPVSVMSNWSTQMEHHIKPEHALRVMFWHGQKKEPITPKSIENYDVVISTYESISSDWFSQKSTSLPRKSGPFSIKWRRVILDEGHNIRNPKAKKTVAISNLIAQSRWSLTGTPIINNLKDLYSQVRFLRLSGGIENFEVFHSAIMRPVMQGHVKGQQVLQMLMSDICLRRKKEMSFIDLRLPPLTEYIHKVKLLPHEQEKYNVLEAEAKGQLDKYRKSIGKKDAASTYRHLLEVLLRLRQVCNHWQLVGEERLDSIMQQLDENGAVDLTDENKLALQKLLQLSIDSQEDCPICLDMYKDPVITTCAHTFCTPCLERIVESSQKCPLCRSPLPSLLTSTVKPAQHLPRPSSQEALADKSSLETSTSTKITAILSILDASHTRDPTTKTILFSQWPSFLSLLSPHLTAASYSFTRIDGSMPPRTRDSALHTFTSCPDTTILLASLSVCSVGLNLVAANQVILADSWWAPAIEDQAVDRVHRLGQTRDTTVWRVVVEGSVEERVLGIQEEKRRVVGVAFAEREDGGRKRKKREGGLGDLVRLLGGTQETQEGGS